MLSREVQIREREQRDHLCGVLRQTFEAHLHVTEYALHDPERMLHPSPNLGLTSEYD